SQRWARPCARKTANRCFYGLLRMYRNIKEVAMLEELKKTKKTSLRALRVNGVAKFQTPGSGSLVIHYSEALKLILASEAHTEFTDHQQTELPAIVSHWLQ